MPYRHVLLTLVASLALMGCQNTSSPDANPTSREPATSSEASSRTAESAEGAAKEAPSPDVAGDERGEPDESDTASAERGAHADRLPAHTDEELAAMLSGTNTPRDTHVASGTRWSEYEDYEAHDVPILTPEQSKRPGALSREEREDAFAKMDTTITAMLLAYEPPESIAQRLREYGCFARLEGTRLEYGTGPNDTKTMPLETETR
jgi:hypothetical protein